MGSTGDPPVPVGGPPTGTSKATPEDSAVLIGRRCPAHSVRRVAGRHRPAARATSGMADIFRLPSLVASFDPAVMKPNFESFRWCSCLAVLLASLGGVQASVPAEEMTTAANKFLGSLKPEQRAKAVFELKSEERLDWHYIPKDRKGLALKEMSDDQQKLALALLASGL